MRDIEKWKQYIAADDWEWLDSVLSDDSAYDRFERIFVSVCEQVAEEAEDEGYEKGYLQGRIDASHEDVL